MRNIPVKNAVLFILTCLTTLMAGAMLKDIDLIKEPWRIYEGISYSFSLIRPGMYT